MDNAVFGESFSDSKERGAEYDLCEGCASRIIHNGERVSVVVRFSAQRELETFIMRIITLTCCCTLIGETVNER
jgi:hypothetical protein